MIGLSRYELKPRQATSVSFSLFAWCLARSTLLLMVWTVVDPPFQAASQDASVAEKRIAFDIPAQPLASALEAYSAATGVEIFYDAVLAAGHRSASVKGSFLPARALETLLLGTGYVPRSTGPDTISIAPGPQGTSQQTIAAKRTRTSPASFPRFLIQPRRGPKRRDICRILASCSGWAEPAINRCGTPSSSFRPRSRHLLSRAARRRARPQRSECGQRYAQL